MALNAMDAAQRGAVIRTRTRCDHARRDGEGWLADLVDGGGRRSQVRARALVNAAGPWVSSFLGEALGVNSAKRVRLIKGSHIVVPRLYPGEHPYILQNDDKRIVFVIPFEGAFSLIGTTDVPYEGDPAAAAIGPDETAYLCRVVNRYFKREIAPADVVWSYAGVRPLYDDASGNASAVTRDYVFDLDAGPERAPLLSIFGGKITTYRKLAEHALEKLQPVMGFTPARGPPMPRCRAATCRVPISRGSWPARREHPWVPEPLLRRWARAYGTRLAAIAGGASRLDDLGRDLGGGLYEAEVRYLAEHEWARTAEDVLWRRSRLGLHVGRDTVVRLEEMLGGVAAPCPSWRRNMSLRLDSPPHGRQRGLDRHAVARSRRRPALRAARPDARRQDLADAPDGRARPAERRAHPGRRRGCNRPIGAQAQRRHGVPAVHQLPDALRLRQHRLAAAAAGHAQGRARPAGARNRPDAAHRPSARPAAGRALRRPAAAARHRPRPGQEAKLLLLDEPLVNLDYKLREELRAELRDLFARQQTTVVYATTEPLEALIMGGEVIVMDEGRVLQTGAHGGGIPSAGLAAGGRGLQRPAHEHVGRDRRGRAWPVAAAASSCR